MVEAPSLGGTVDWVGVSSLRKLKRLHPKGSRIKGVEGSRGMLKNFRELIVWQKSYQLCLDIYRIGSVTFLCCFLRKLDPVYVIGFDFG